MAAAGVLELPKLLPAFENCHEEPIGLALVDALGRSPGLKSLQAESLLAALSGYPESVRQKADGVLKTLAVNREQQQAKLASLAAVLTGGDIQRGRELFFGNKKAICATCHAVQGQGGQIGPDLTRIGAIRARATCWKPSCCPASALPAATNRSTW